MFDLYNALFDTARNLAVADSIPLKILAVVIYALGITYGVAVILFPFNIWRIASSLSAEIDKGKENQKDERADEGSSY